MAYVLQAGGIFTASRWIISCKQVAYFQLAGGLLSCSQVVYFMHAGGLFHACRWLISCKHAAYFLQAGGLFPANWYLVSSGYYVNAVLHITNKIELIFFLKLNFLLPTKNRRA